MLSKRFLFIGYMSSCNVVVMAISNAAIAVGALDQIWDQIKATEETSNTVFQIIYRMYAHNTIEDAKWKVRENKTKDKPWFIDKYYDESIKQVIGKAIADYVTHMNEFKDKKAGDLITFDGPEYEDRPEDYTQENWNAVVLYNFVARQFERYKEAHQQKGLTWSQRWKEIKEYIGQPIKDHYEKYFTENNLVDKIAGMKDAIDDAIRDIDLYEEALNLSPFMIATNLFGIVSDGILKFPGTIDGKTREDALLWHPMCPDSFNSVVYVRRENRQGMLDQMIYADLHPKFYLYEGVYYIAGYYGWDYCLGHEYKLKPMTKDKIDNTLIPISQKAEESFNKNEELLKQTDRQYSKKKQLCNNAHKIFNNLNEIFTPIFGDLVKVSPLYCD